MKIRVLLTGGTIDKHYNESNGNMEFADSHISAILEQGRNRSDLQIDTVMFKDSLEMIDHDRKLIANSCANCFEEKILITHGTDTMIQTANHIVKNKPQLVENKCIVFVGAMIPYEISYSDSAFNVGFALGALNSLDNGIYIAMNGKIFTANNVKKNLSLGEFQELI